MATKFEDLVNNMINVGFGAAAVAAEKGKEVLDGLANKGEEVRADASAPDFARSMSDIFERAGGAFTDATARLGTQGETVAERVLDELILARARQLTATERAAFARHVEALVDSIEDPVTVEVESAEAEGTATDPAASDAAASGDAAADERAGE